MSKTSLRLGFAALLLVTSGFAAAADNIDRNVRIHNDTGVTIYRFYSTNSGASNWGNDVMGDSTLVDGSSMGLNFDNKYAYCEFDFRAEFSDGDVLEKKNVNVCEISDYNYTQ
jgi:hypothetical protein